MPNIKICLRFGVLQGGERAVNKCGRHSEKTALSGITDQDAFHVRPILQFIVISTVCADCSRTKCEIIMRQKSHDYFTTQRISFVADEYRL